MFPMYTSYAPHARHTHHTAPPPSNATHTYTAHDHGITKTTYPHTRAATDTGTPRSDTHPHTCAATHTDTHIQ